MSVPEETFDFSTYVANSKFHRSFHLPPDQARGRSQSLRVTYADFGYQDDAGSENETVILICGPLLATRYLHIAKDELAKEQKVRLIHPDRFGFGGLAEVGAAERVAVWLEIVPALLQHLNVKHVSLMAQSGGTIFALNVLLKLRHLLHPTHPYLALGAPWVLPSHSGATAMQLLKVFPEGAVSSFDSLARWFNNNVIPATGFSENIVTAVGSTINSIFSPSGRSNQEDSAASENEAAFVFEEQLRPTTIQMAYAENIEGLGQEALLLLKRGNSPDWGIWEDYDRYVPMLADVEKSARKPDGQKLKVEVFFAETDILIGNKAGPKFFDDCWRDEMRGPHIEYHSQFVKGTDHDGIFDLRWGVVQKIFAEARRRSEVS